RAGRCLPAASPRPGPAAPPPPPSHNPPAGPPALAARRPTRAAAPAGPGFPGFRRRGGTATGPARRPRARPTARSWAGPMTGRPDRSARRQRQRSAHHAWPGFRGTDAPDAAGGKSERPYTFCAPVLPLEVRLARHIASTPAARPIRQARTAATRDRILAAAEAILA